MTNRFEMGTNMDIDELKKMNQELQEVLEVDKQWYQAIEKLIPGGVGIYEYTDKIIPIYASEGLSALASYTEKEATILRADLTNVILAEDMEKLEKEIASAMKEHRMIDISLRYYCSRDKLGWLWVRGDVLKKNDNHILFYALLLDITNQKRMENQLQIQTARYHILEETTEEILFEYRPREDVMEYSLKEIDGTLSHNKIPAYMDSLDQDPMVHEDYIEEFKEHLANALKTPSKGELEYLSRISGRGYEWHRMNYVSVEDENGEITSVFGRTKNIHDEVLERQILHSKTTIDQMTHLYNNSFIKEKINNRLIASMDDTVNTLILVGINQFNRIVEQNGHACGDAVIQKVSSLIQENLFSIAIVGRQGNEKFLAYATDCDEETTDEKIRDFVAALSLPENKVADIIIDCSVGVTTVIGPAEFDELYEKVDEALYLAKITKETSVVRV